MKHSLFFMLTICALACQPVESFDPADYSSYPYYEGEDLGLTFVDGQAHFRVWAPTADTMIFRLYDEDMAGESDRIHPMVKAEAGTWTYELTDDHLGKYYTFQAIIGGEAMEEVPDPYAVATGRNGMRAQIVDMDDMQPEGWSEDKLASPPVASDIILYELHMRDVSMHPNSGINHKGKFLGLAETGTTGPGGVATGLDHIAEMGVTHVHLLPVFDFRSIDETKLEENNFNWGYDPQNYNTPEGSYSTDPADGRTRVREFRQLVMAMHQKGLGVVMDVVYNHTGATEESLFNQLVPGYYYRQKEDGSFSDASACGNETASERAMMRKFIIESVKHWAKEYHIDGFRFDLMGIHDIETMNLVAAELKKISPHIFVYGEGWAAGESPLPDSSQALKRNVPDLVDVAAFSDDIRDGLKGSVFVEDETGFVSGAEGLEETIKFGVAAATAHPQVDFLEVNYSDGPWAPQPTQCITYVSCHDNNTLWDKLSLSRPEVSEAERMKMHRLALAIVMTSQGVPFLHAGVEMRRTKGGEENSYNLPDEVNRIDWSWKAEQAELVDFVKALIALRKTHPAFRMETTEAIAKNLAFVRARDGLVVYRINGDAAGDKWKDILVFLNGSNRPRTYQLPDGLWKVALEGKEVDLTAGKEVRTKTYQVEPVSACILVSP